MSDLSEYPHIEQWLGNWMEQLPTIGEEDSYRVICHEVEQSGTFKDEATHLRRLDEHLDLANKACSNFDECMLEKQLLPSNIDQANITILNKLAEVRAIVGLSRLGFENLTFIESPDFSTTYEGNTAYIEVTRLNNSFGKRSNVWDESYGDLEKDGYMIGVMNERHRGRGSKAVAAISEAIYRKVEDKYKQLQQVSDQDALHFLWISLGRDYINAGRYELPGVDEVGRTENYIDALQDTIAFFEGEGAYGGLRIVLSCGRDNPDTVVEVQTGG